MNMWAVSALPVYSVEPDTRRKGSKRPSISKAASTLAFPPKSHPSQEYHLQQNLHHSDTDGLSVFLEPAIDGPPSPESIRAQMKRAAATAKDKHQSHHTTSSGSSSLRSLASTDRPSWENTLESLTLSRKSSGRSTSSSMPSRERPESVQIFGKTIFNRRGKFRRESSAQSSPGSSLYSGDVPIDTMVPPAPTSVPMRDSTIPAFFSRRRAASRAEPADETGPARKFQISEPYNFQHVTHTQKDHVPELQRVSRQHLGSEFAHVRASQSLGPGQLRAGRAEDMHFADFSSDNLLLNHEDEFIVPHEPYSRISMNRPPSLLPKSPPRRLVKHTQSQDHLRIPPPRPPRSPIDQIFAPAPPIPPPRISSRTSMRNDDFDPLGSGPMDRPHTAGSFRHPQPLTFSSDASMSPPSTSHSYLPVSDMNAIPEHSQMRFSSPSSDDANWPLPCSTTVSFDSTLPNVPEEDENAFISKRSRASLTSVSSLRGSQSVPMLRPISTRQEDCSRRRSSGASDTLGRFDMFAAQRALKAALDGDGAEPLPRESWEDDIDYCYEHAAEADCDFAWERPSLELCRDTDSVTPSIEDQAQCIPSCEVSPAMLTPGQFDLPALSPASQASSTAGMEAITPTVLAPPRASNFSLPRTEVTKSNLLHLRRASDASSFKESHGFTLSPSLLIPKDFQHQMAASEADSPDSREPPYHHYEDAGLNMDMIVHVQNRVSVSTTGTMESSRSGFERHISTTSTSTDFTRLTASTSSLDTDNFFVRPESLHRFPSFESSKLDGISAMPTLSESEEITPDAGSGARSQFMSHGSDPNLVKLGVEETSTHRRKESIQARRGRARTTSLSTPPPPNQYALFPSVHMSGSRI